MTGVDLDEVRRRYTAEEPPPCRVCGAELSIQSMGGGEATKWACADLPRVGSDEWSDHYRRSGWVQYKHGDPDVLALVDEVADLRALFDLQGKRMGEATARWRAEDPEARALILPDLGDLLKWLMGEADRQRDAVLYREASNRHGLVWQHTCGRVECFDRPRPGAPCHDCGYDPTGDETAGWQPLYVRVPGGAR